MRRLVTGVNALTAAAVAVAVVILGRDVFFASRPAAVAVVASPSVAAPITMPGLPGLDVQRAPKTLVIVMQRTCGFCASSMPFYGHLVQLRNDSRANVRIVVASPVRDGDLRDYLASFRFAPDALVHYTRDALQQVRVTPTLLLLNSRGELLQKWEGVLSDRLAQGVTEAISAR